MRRRLIYGPKEARVLLVGEAPSRAIDHQPSLGLLREDLAELAGVEHPIEWWLLFARANLLPRWPGRSPGGKGDRFPREEARRRARRLRGRFGRFSRVVLLGRRVEGAFDLRGSGWFAWRDAFKTRVAVAPHPSKVSRWWNDSNNVALARTFWRELAATARGGKTVWEPC